MNERFLEIREYKGAGYQPLIDFDTWRVAVLRWEETQRPEFIRSMERHVQTDEVFVLLDGQAKLILGGDGDRVEGVYAQMLEKCRLYNVKQDVWHAVLLSTDASILIVENRDTGKENTEYCNLSAEIRREIIKLSGRGF
jgi:ureidoglycolate hydrolase